MKCICHSIHLCASEAVKTLPRHCEDLIRNIYTHLSYSVVLKENTNLSKHNCFQSLNHIKCYMHARQDGSPYINLLRGYQNSAWEALKMFFTQFEAEERLKTVEYIVKDLKDKSVYLYLNFLNYILPLFNKLNLLFQRDTPTIHLVYVQVREFYITLLRSFCCRELIDKGDITKFNPQLYRPIICH